VLISQAGKGNSAMVRFLIGQKVNPTHEHAGNLALSAAAVAGDRELIGILLKGGARVNDVNADGRTALMIACSVGSIDFIQALLDAGADVSLRSKNGKTSLHYAAVRALPELVDLLLARGADATARDRDGDTPLDLALLTSARAAAVVLSAHGATVDIKSSRATELLAAALAMNIRGVVHAALAEGWSADTKFHDAWPALWVARACQATDCVALLEQAGANTSLGGVPPLVSAREIDTRPKLISDVAPEDPRDPDSVLPASLVELDVILDSQGLVRFPVVSSLADRRLALAALQAVNAWRFSPITRNGQPVCVRVTLPVRFPEIADPVVQWTKADLLPLPLKRYTPVYPPELAQSHQVGRVSVAYTVGKDGRVHNVRVKQSSHPGFEKPAIAAILQWKFKPGVFEGKPADIRMEQEIVFSFH